METSEKPRLISDRMLDNASHESYPYGNSMVRFAKAYHQIKLLEALGITPEGGEIDYYPYPQDLGFCFIQKPGEPEHWKNFYSTLRRNDWQRSSNSIIDKSKMTLVLSKNTTSLKIEVSFPMCKVEVIGHETITTQKPIYSINCEGSQKLEDPEPLEKTEPSPVPNHLLEEVPLMTSLTESSDPHPDDEIPF